MNEQVLLNALAKMAGDMEKNKLQILLQQEKLSNKIDKMQQDILKLMIFNPEISREERQEAAKSYLDMGLNSYTKDYIIKNNLC